MATDNARGARQIFHVRTDESQFQSRRAKQLLTQWGKKFTRNSHTYVLMCRVLRIANPIARLVSSHRCCLAAIPRSLRSCIHVGSPPTEPRPQGSPTSTLNVYFDFRAAAQRFLCAAAILARASGLRFRFPVAAFFVLAASFLAVDPFLVAAHRSLCA